jgi:hypothetical protein
MQRSHLSRSENACSVMLVPKESVCTHLTSNSHMRSRCGSLCRCQLKPKPVTSSEDDCAHTSFTAGIRGPTAADVAQLNTHTHTYPPIKSNIPNENQQKCSDTYEGTKRSCMRLLLQFVRATNNISTGEHDGAAGRCTALNTRQSFVHTHNCAACNWSANACSECWNDALCTTTPQKTAQNNRLRLPV